jgi:hypothetical protein
MICEGITKKGIKCTKKIKEDEKYCNYHKQKTETNNILKQRNVNPNLGKNITKYHNLIYNEIEKRIGKTKSCNFGHIKGSKTGVKHEGCFDVPIRDFELKGVSIQNDKVVIKSGDGLQYFCKNCSKTRRQFRLNKEKEEKKNKTTEQIYELYNQKYGKNVKKCSRCKIEKELCCFYISYGMECGLHNVCKICTYEYSSSVKDRWIIYMPDGNYKYKKYSNNLHDDHIFPLSLGGSNLEINHQLIGIEENLKKSNEIIQFEDLKNIIPEQISERFRFVLKEATDLNDLKIKLSGYMFNDIKQRSNLSDKELYLVYQSYCQKNNLRKNVPKAIEKFRKYCLLRIN